MAQLDYDYIAELVIAANNGDSNAFSELYAATYQKQYAFARSYLKDDFLSQDALQETYITAFRNLSSLSDPKLFISWLNQINFRTCYKMLDKEIKHTQGISDFTDFEEGQNQLTEHSAESEVMKGENKKIIMDEISKLPPNESKVIYLHYFNSLTLDQIAETLNISRSSVKRYLAKGKELLADKLSYLL